MEISMKHIKKIAILIAFLALVCIFSSCRAATIELPGNINIDENNLLTWSKVEMAKSYTLQITHIGSEEEPEEHTLRKTSYSLMSLMEGDYEIRIRTVSGDPEKKDSPWSEVLEFHKDYTTGCVYTQINNGAAYEITKVGQASGVVKIEDIYKGKPVTQIANNAFKGNGKITEVILGANIKSIGNYAFSGCNSLTSVTLNEGLTTIGDDAFQSCKVLQSIKIPNSIESVGEGAFAYCTALKTVDLGTGYREIEVDTFYKCAALEEVVIPDQVTYIGANAFQQCASLRKVTIGAGVTELPENCFNSCTALTEVNFSDQGNLNYIGIRCFDLCSSLQSITIPEGVDTIDVEAFRRCEKLESVDLPSTMVNMYRFVFNGTKIYNDAVQRGEGLIYIDHWLVASTDEFRAKIQGIGISASTSIINVASVADGTVGIASRVFSACPVLESAVIPSSVKYVGSYCFYNCPLLTTARFNSEQGKGLIMLGGRCFQSCPKLLNVHLGNTVQRIEEYAFRYCQYLDSVVIPDSVTSIGTYAFIDTKMWTSAPDMSNADNPDEQYTTGLVYAGDWLVGYNENMVSSQVKLKKATRGIADYALYECTDLSSISGVENALYVGKAAFSDCEKLSIVNLNRLLTKIEDFTFYKCSSLYSINVPIRIESIGQSAFYKCESLRRLDFSDVPLKSIGYYAFLGCTNLQYIGLSKELTEIPAYAFYKCSSIVDITLKENVTSIDERAFSYCTSLDRITIGENVKSIGDYAFRDCTALKEIALPNSVTSLGKYAFFKCTSLAKIDLGTGVTAIKDYTFADIGPLTELHIPASVTSIGRFAFKRCNSLFGVILPSTVQYLDQHSFYGCKNITFYTDAKEPGVGWNNRWNSSFRPVVWGCTLTADGKNVESITVTENSFTNFNEKKLATGVTADGKICVGWAIAPGGEAEYTVEETNSIPQGTTLYPVWEDAPISSPQAPQTNSNQGN